MTDRIEAAEAALAQAKNELKKAKVEAKALKTLELLNTAARAVWDIAAASEHDGAEWVYALERDVDNVANAIAGKVLGATQRSLGLALLDADRWGSGQYSTNEPRRYTSDETLHSELATWIFDRTGVRGYSRDAGSDWTNWSERFHAEILAAFTQHIGAERAKTVADGAITAWREGRHDT